MNYMEFKQITAKKQIYTKQTKKIRPAQAMRSFIADSFCWCQTTSKTYCQLKIENKLVQSASSFSPNH